MVLWTLDADPALDARLTAIHARAGVAAIGLVLALTLPGLHPTPPAAALGFALMIATSAVHRFAPGFAFTRAEELLASVSVVLIIGLGHQQVTILSVLWLAAGACGVVSRTGHKRPVGWTIGVLAVIAPMVVDERVEPAYLGFGIAALGLLATCARLGRELTRVLAQARHAADHDALTGAMSRAALRVALTGMLADGREVRLLLVDLDDFGAVNKTQGHAAGDRLLVEAVRRIERGLPVGAQLGRLGGDEFAVVCPAGAHVTGSALLALLARGDTAIVASVGVAHGPVDAADAEGMLRAADVALRVAKRYGKSRCVVYDAASLTDDPVTGAHGALMRLIGGEGLSVVVQPIVDIASGDVHGYEALARFHTKGTTAPLHWFALADELGLRAELELACLRKALRLFEQRPAGTRMTVNLSARLLLDRRLHTELDAVGDLEGLVIEVTEDSLAREDAGLLVALRPLLDRGIVLAVDDVGAGYSGLGQLTVLRPALVKLDRGLVTDIDRSPHRAALVEALVGYARRTGGELVAEGVETEAELRTVAALGVRLAQGYLLARPGAPWPVPRVLDRAAPAA